MQDSEGFISFKDRLGDTFRVKGHNISTTEVESCLSAHPDVVSVNVYAIPMNAYGYEGQLGCAAITFRDGFSRGAEKGFVNGLEEFVTKSSNSMPSYAVPRFLRILENSSLPDQSQSFGETSERVSNLMKKKKVELRNEGT